MTPLAGVEPDDHLDALVRVAQIPESDQVLFAGSQPGDPLARYPRTRCAAKAADRRTQP